MKKIIILFISIAALVLALASLSSCDMLFKDEEDPYDCLRTGEHNWQYSDKRKSTCMDEGAIFYYCNICSTQKTESIPKSDHAEFTDKGAEPTCHSEGYIGRTYCLTCGKTLKEEEIIPQLDHRIEVQNKVDPTCTEDGYTGDEVCLDCGVTITKGKRLFSNGHNYVCIPGYDATCFEDGLSDGYYCDVCDTTLDEQYVIEAAHYIEYIWEYEPTCTEPGRTEGSWCSRCETYFEIPETIPALGHSEYIETHGYEATCYSNGLTDQIACERCDEIIIKCEIIPAAHNEVSIPAIEPTCTSYGYTEGKACTYCEEIIIEPVQIAKNKHSNIVDVEGFAATCQTAGYSGGKICADCGTPTVNQYTISALGHFFGEDGHCDNCDLVATDCLKYVKLDSSYKIVGFQEGFGDDVSVLVIPDTYNGLPVWFIDEKAFENCESLTKVVIPASIQKIQLNAFNGCSNLETVEIHEITFSNSDIGYWLGNCEDVEILITNGSFNNQTGLSPYEIYLAAMNKINHNLNRYELISDGYTTFSYGGTTQKMISTYMVQRQYNNNFYVYQKSTDHMSYPNKVEAITLYYVNNYLYIPNVNGTDCMTLCSPEAFGDMFMTDSGDIPPLTAKFFKDASFSMTRDGKMYLTIEMDEELIEELITIVAGIDANMSIYNCTYSYVFDANGNIISYTTDMNYTLDSFEYPLNAVSTVTFNEVGTLAEIKAPTGYTDISQILSNQCKYGHTIVECDAVPATCFAYGKTAYTYCSVCYLAIEPYTTIQPAHNYEDGYCSDCGNFEDDDVSTGLAYELNEDGTGYILVGVGSYKGADITVPQYIYGLPVLSISADAFENIDPYVKVIVGNKGWYISNFEGCEDTTQYWQ